MSEIDDHAKDESPFWSVKEENFIKLCRDNNIEYKLETSQDGNRVYTITIEPEYLDGIEKLVVEHCRKNDIKFTFGRDRDGNHHYNFSQLVCLDTGKECYKDAPITSIQLRLRNIRTTKLVEYTWWEKLLNKISSWVKRTKSKTEDEMFLESLGMDRETLLRLGLPDEDF